jgi:predicted RNase H-like nuclease (RuvC/YqgF family)
MWPRPESRIPYPSLKFLIRNAVAPLVLPAPLPERYLEKYKKYLSEVSTLTDELETLMNESSEKTVLLNDLKTSMTSFNRWKDASGKIGTHKKLTEEIAALEKKIHEKRVIKDKLQSEHQSLAKLVQIQCELEQGYDEYMNEHCVKNEMVAVE